MAKKNSKKNKLKSKDRFRNSIITNDSVEIKREDMTESDVSISKSNTGRILSRTLSLRAIKIPTGIPKITHKKMLISIIAVVSIALVQKIGCKKPIKKVHKPTKTVVPIFLPLAK